MPDADGRFLGAYFGLSPDRWARIFGSTSSCSGPKGECNCNVEIEWIPDPSLDGAVFTPECGCGERCEDPRSEGCKNPKS